MGTRIENQDIEKRAIALFQGGTSTENIAVILKADVETIERIVFKQQKKIIEAPSKEKGKEVRNKKIRQEYKDGKTAIYLANKHGLHVSSIYIICKGIKKKPKPRTSPLPKKNSILVPLTKIEHDLHRFEPRYTERRLLFGTLKVYVGDICVQCGKVVQLKNK